MDKQQDSLFSLEVVVEKLYLPYVTCRFPAVAFRLLDFPTILISHVETELASRIRKKISIDPHYQLPNQFADLQDKHGNFLMKKGKSCLFKISVETLAMHLENTPMYIMVIDEFPDVPKLLGNSSLAMNEIMDAVKRDIRTNGITVPSVQGDKGLFKIYSLMGKEIGYMIVGFRLLSLGPGLIAHLPATAIAKRASEKKQESVNVQPKSVIQEVIESKTAKTLSSKMTSNRQEAMRSNKEALDNTREMGSMTDVEKCDALMQTVDMIDENIHVTVSEKNKKDLKTIETQTEYILKPKRVKKDIQTVSEKLKFAAEESDDSDDGLAINQHIACPPPLFYNKNAEPEIHIERDVNPFHTYENTFDDPTVEDLSEDEHGFDTSDKMNRLEPKKQSQEEKVYIDDARTVVISNVKREEKKLPLFQIQNNGVGSENAFPILNALLQELSKIQSPQQHSANVEGNQAEKVEQIIKENIEETIPVKTKTDEKRKDIPDTSKDTSKIKAKKQSKADSMQSGQKQKGWIRKAPETSIKKTKLVFGLTNTQRLRLAKQNPEWLKTAEQDEKVAKAQRQKPQKQRDIDVDHDAGNLSDTFTEVRRLAAAELENTTMALNVKEERVRKFKKKRPKSRENSPSKDKSGREKSVAPKAKPRVFGTKTDKAEVLDTTGDSRELERTADMDAQEAGMAEQKPESLADSVPSSKIEVRIPSARDYESDDHDNTFTDSFEDVDADRRYTKSKFPGFNSGENLPDSILPEGNTSINSTQLDDDSPLESTRMSKQFKAVPGDTVFKSTEDYDTRQFQSTDEPELQKLISEDEKSETGITPVTDRSVRSQSPIPRTTVNNSARLSMKFEVLNPTASQQSPLPSLRRSQQLKVDSFSARPTPTDTPRSRSSQSSPKNPTPRPRKPIRDRRIDFKKDSIHTESVSSYVPSESENILSLISDGSYSDDFHMSSEKDRSSQLSTPELPKVSGVQRLIPNTKLGFTIH